MRIAHFRRAFGAVSETFVSEPILRLTAMGVDNRVFTLLSLDPSSPVGHVAMAKPRNDGGSRIEKRSRALPRMFSKLDVLGWPIARRWLYQQLQSASPDVLVSHFGPDACLAAPVATRLRIPHIAFFYGYDAHLTGGSPFSPWSRLYPRLFASADSICTTSHYLATRLAALGAPANKVSVIHAGIDLQRFPWSDPAARFDGELIRLIHVGRLTAAKSPLKLLQAFQEAARLCPSRRFELTIAGEGELGPASRQLARDLGVSAQVAFCGRVPPAEVAGMLASHHLYTQYGETTASGQAEALGVSLIEASATGLPIVSTRIGGIPEVVIDGVSGLLSPEGDVTAMARNIVTLASAPERWQQMGRAGRAHVESRFDLDRQAAALLDHCRSIAR